MSGLATDAVVSSEIRFMASTNRLQHIIQCLTEYRKLWLLPAIAGLVLATGYAFILKGESWTARQTMIIRDDLLGENFKPGSFLSEEAMKSAQETVLETARRPEVIRATLEKIGPSRKSLFGLGGVPSNWPSEKTIEEMREAITFESANGGEFGKSEVIVLAAKSSNPERSAQLLSVLTEEVDRKLADVRADRLESMESELEATCHNARASSVELQKQLVAMEREFGRDVSIVRSINDPNSAGSPSAFDTRLSEIQAEQRKASRDLAATKAFKRVLERAQRSPDIDLPTSAEMLASRPLLKALIENLAKAKQVLSQAEGTFTDEHPDVKNARNQIRSMKLQIKEEIPAAIRGLDNQIAMFQERVDMAENQLAINNEKLQKVGGKRIPWVQLTKELQKRTEDYTEASTKLAQIRSRKDASGSISLLTKIGDPWVGTRADGMGKRTMALAGGIGGLFIGFGLVMIVAPPFIDPEQAALDSNGTDVDPGNAESDPEPQTSSNPTGRQNSSGQYSGSGAVPTPPQRVPTPPQPMPIPETPQVFPNYPVPATSALNPGVTNHSTNPALPPVPETQTTTQSIPPMPSPSIQVPQQSVVQGAQPSPQSAAVNAQPATSPTSTQTGTVLETGSAPLNLKPRSETQETGTTANSLPTQTTTQPTTTPQPQTPRRDVPTTIEPVTSAASIAASQTAAPRRETKTVPVPNSTDTIHTQTDLQSFVSSLAVQSSSENEGTQSTSGAQASTESTARPVLPARPVSKTLAAIFANMPQPKMDASVVPPVPSGDESTNASDADEAQSIVEKIESLTNELQKSTHTPTGDSRGADVQDDSTRRRNTGTGGRTQSAATDKRSSG